MDASAAILSAVEDSAEEYEGYEGEYLEDQEGLLLGLRADHDDLLPPRPNQVTRRQKVMAGESSSFIRCQSTECPECTIRTCAELDDQSGLLIATSLCVFCAPETNLPFLCTRKNPCPTWPKQEQERFLQQRSVLPVGTSAATTPSQEARLEERSHLRRSPRLLALQARTLEEDEDDAAPLGLS